MLSEEILNNIKNLSDENLLKSYNTLSDLVPNEDIIERLNVLHNELEQRRK